MSKNKETDQYKNLQKIPEEERALFKKNGLSVKGQSKILNTIKTNINNDYDLLVWNRFPKSSEYISIIRLSTNEYRVL